VLKLVKFTAEWQFNKQISTRGTLYEWAAIHSFVTDRGYSDQ